MSRKKPVETALDAAVQRQRQELIAANAGNTILDRWEISAEELSAAVDANPSLRGMLFGYVAEIKLTEILEAHEQISNTFKHDDHDRKKKGDRVVSYKGHEFVIESKSLQTNSIRYRDQKWIGDAQVDASDRRVVMLPNGKRINTTLLRFGEFDVLAVNVFEFTQEWMFVYAKNGDLPTSTFRGYSLEDKQHLIKSLIPVSWPPELPFHQDLFQLLDTMVAERESQSNKS